MLEAGEVAPDHAVEELATVEGGHRPGVARLQQVHVLGEMNKNIACDVSLSQEELGYEPAVELYEGMRRSIRWCVEQGLEL